MRAGSSTHTWIEDRPPYRRWRLKIEWAVFDGRYAPARYTLESAGQGRFIKVDVPSPITTTVMRQAEREVQVARERRVEAMRRMAEQFSPEGRVRAARQADMGALPVSPPNHRRADIDARRKRAEIIRDALIDGRDEREAVLLAEGRTPNAAGRFSDSDYRHARRLIHAAYAWDEQHNGGATLSDYPRPERRGNRL